eukprot:5964448-Amphidinium_carterae.1
MLSDVFDKRGREGDRISFLRSPAPARSKPPSLKRSAIFSWRPQLGTVLLAATLGSLGSATEWHTSCTRTGMNFGGPMGGSGSWPTG